jgi:DNA-binding beta-propeller fold protein YncE
VTQLQTDGTAVGTYKVGNGPAGIAFDGTNLWLACSGGQKVQKLSPGGSVLAEYATGREPSSVLFDGTRIWVSNVESRTMSVIDEHAEGKVRTIPLRFDVAPAAPQPVRSQ